jgi:phthiocerol/phenolphthiocerol synthesis type-I polyketide synthase E
VSRDDRLLNGVAIVGMACRFPGARNPGEFWRNLRDGVESIHFFSDAELLEAGAAPELLADPSYVKARAVLGDTELFDASFFGFTPRIAEVTDPQQRLMLECAWECLESAGYDPERVRGDVGVFAGTGMSTYLLSNLGRSGAFAAAGTLQTVIGNRTDHLALMMAYKLNLRGPAVTVQTTCSTSLVAVHLGCQSLLDYQCDMVLAGGISIEVPQQAGYRFVEGGIGSPDGHCRPFDAAAQGTLSGSGGGVVALKRMEDALAGGDAVRAVILGSAINNDGANKIGYTAPSDDRQARVIAVAQSVAGVHPEDITYIEAHGTATPLGDMIEIAALNKVFGAKTRRRAFCALGSVKSNFGHLDTAAGIAGLIKTVLALEHREIPPTLHFERPNPEIGLADGPFFVNAELREWPAGGSPRRAGVSSFGIGGTNAHVVLEEAPEPASSGPSRPWQLLLLSARTGTALQTATERLRQHLGERPRLPLADVAFTLQAGRRVFAHRRAAICRDDPADAVELLASLDPTRVYGGTQEPRRQPVIFLFPGQGAQHPGMGRRLYAVEPEFRRQMDRCCEILRPLLGLDLRAELWDDRSSAAEAQARLDQTALAQPALFAVEYALARLWMSWGIEPAAMLGHSLGEYVAACLAEVFPIEEALRLMAERGRLIQALPAGAMLAVQLPEREARLWLSEEIALAAVNRPSLCVLSGPLAAIERLEAELGGRGVVCRRLRTSHAFHSPMMDPALAAFRDEVRKAAPRAPMRPYVSNLTGSWIRPEEATDPEYWVRHLRETVRFAAGTELLLRELDGLFLEVGPGITLATLVRQHPSRSPGRVVLSSLRHPRESDPEDAALLAALGRLWLAGVEPDWQGFYAHERRRRVELPAYPFERQRYWCGTGGPAGGGAEPLARRADLTDWFYTSSWRRSHLAAALPSAEPRQRWLIFANPEPLARDLGERLAGLGQEVVRVEPGAGFASLGEGAWRIDPQRREDYESLLAELERRGTFPERLVHLWTVSPAAADPADPEQQREQLDLGYHSLVGLAQALGRRALPPGLSLDVVSSNLHEVVGGDLWWPEKAALLGLLRVLPKELPGLRCRGIDIAAPRDQAEAEALGGLLLVEILAASEPPVIAYRGGHRWLPEFMPLPLTSAAPPLHRLRPRGSYLITGGLGGVGLTLAEELARAAQARLTLLGRTPLPPRDEWDHRLTRHGEDDPASRRLRRLREIEALGAEVLVLSADVASGEQMRAAVAAARERFGAIHGVIHAAGTSTGGLLQLRAPEQTSEVLAPKIQGTRELAAALGPGELDFFVLCSSRSAFLGQAGGADYAAANAFLDAFAHAGRADWGDGLMAIAWCAWRDVGMLADAARQASQPPATPGEPTRHPLLERRQAEAGRDVYHTRFSAERQWVANEHRIAGHPVIPGTTYLEMARAAFEQRTGEGTVELHDVFFLTPVRLRDDEERLLRLMVEPEGEGFTFRISNRAAPDSWEETMLGGMRPLPPGPLPRHDLAALRQRCGRRQILAVDEDERFEDLGPRWQNVKQVYLGDGEVLGAVELAEELAGDLEQFKLHPSLIDRAAGLGEQFLIDLTQGFYLPLSYASLKIRAPLPRKLYSHVRLRDTDYARQETISFDVVLMDEEGFALAEIEGYSKKRVNNTVEQLRELAANSREASGSREAAFAQALELGITPEEGQEIFRRVLAHRLPPQIVISPSDLAAVIARAGASSARLLEAAQDLAAEALEEHERPAMGTLYMAPRNQLEQRLAALWQAALGVKLVGVDDNFFELGGDSVLGIQIVARAHRLGLQITPGQLFEFQTIGQLAQALAPGAAQLPPVPAEPAASAPRSVPGEVPLTPFQRRLLERGSPNPHRFNVTQLFEVHALLDWPRVASLLPGFTREHDALRLRFFPAEDGWRQVLVPAGDSVPFIIFDLSALPAGRQSAAVEAAAEALQGSLHLSRGPLVRLAAFDLGAGRPGRLLFVGHHLVLDHISVYILAEDLARRYEAAGPPAPSASFQDWAERLHQLANSTEMAEEAAWWLGLPWERTVRLPQDHPGGENTGFTRRVATVHLDGEETRILLDELPPALGASVEEILLTAAAWALAGWTGVRVQLLQRVVHGRTSPFPDLEVARTVGWFAADYPVVLDLSGAGDPLQAVEAVVRQLRGVPRDGIGYGLLRFCARRPDLEERFRSLPTAEVSFNYLGRQGQRKEKRPSVFSDAAESPGAASDPEARRPSLLNVSAFVVGDRLRVDWTYSGRVHTPATLERLTVGCASALSGLLLAPRR